MDLTGDESREHYIPLRPAELVARLADQPTVTIFERQQFGDLCELAAAIIHHDFHASLKRLLGCYAAFDPDDGGRLSPAAAKMGKQGAKSEEDAGRFFEEFDALLRHANYCRLSREEIERAAEIPGPSGLKLHLDLTIFERLEVYVRGRSQIERLNPSWRVGRPGQSQTVPAYRRLAIVFKLKDRSPRTDPLDAGVVALKLFKDIPCDDLEALLPGAWVKMGLLEQAKIVLPTISGLALTLLKLMKGAAAITFASLYGLAAFLGLVGGALGYGVKSFFSYLNVREKHQLSLTRQLYYQNLDNNAGVIYHLLAEAEEQEFRELVLGWWLLWRGGFSGATAAQIDGAAEGFLREQFQLDVDFEVADALGKLERLGLAFSSPTGRWRAVEMEEALERLDRYWDDQFQHRRPRVKAADETRPRLYRQAA